MKKITSLNSGKLTEIISQIEHQIFDLDFYAKYGFFFDFLIQNLISPEMKYPEEFNRMINGIILFWNDPEKLHYLYETTSCDLIYALYVRINLLAIHAKSLKNNVEIPENTLAEQFKFLITKYYNSNVHTSLTELRDGYFL